METSFNGTFNLGHEFTVISVIIPAWGLQFLEFGCDNSVSNL